MLVSGAGTARLTIDGSGTLYSYSPDDTTGTLSSVQMMVITWCFKPKCSWWNLVS